MPVSFYSELAAARLPLSSPMTSLADKDMWRKFMTIDCDTCAPLRSAPTEASQWTPFHCCSLSHSVGQHCITAQSIMHVMSPPGNNSGSSTSTSSSPSHSRSQSRSYSYSERLRCLLSGNKLVSCLYWLWLRLGVMRPICLPFHIDFYCDCDCDCDCYPSCWNSKICAQ